jgi:hypothetical protein
MNKLFILILLTYSCANSDQKNSPVVQTPAPVQAAYQPIPASYKTIPKNADGGWYKPLHGLKPGDVVVLEGDYAYINLDSVIGTQDQPIIFKPKGIVNVGLNGAYGWIITNSKYFIIDGRTASEQYGIKIGGLPGQFISQSFTFPSSDNFEISNVELRNAQVGFFANPITGDYTNIRIHDNYIHALNNPTESGRSEGVYLGNTGKATTTTGGKFSNVEISNNRFENLSGDGIQAALTENVFIHHNHIKGYGQANLEQQRSAIIIGGCTSGRVEDNTISEGTGSPIQVFGGGEVFVRRNKISNVATSDREDGIYIDGKCADGPLRVHLVNNSIDKVSRSYVKDASGSVIEKTGNNFGN